MALASTGQEDFSSGIARGRKVPANAVHDCVNGMINDEGLIYRRGGTAYHSTGDAGQTLTGIANMGFVGPDTDRTLMWGGNKLYILNTSAGPIELYDDTTATMPYGRPVGVGGVAVFPISPGPAILTLPAHNRVLVYGGTLLPSGGDYGGSTITVTNGSVSVTKAGGATWVGAVDPGQFLLVPGAPHGIVRSVESANALTLVSAYAGSTASTSGYTIQPHLEVVLAVGSSPYVPAPPLSSRVFVGSSGMRLLVAAKNRIYPAERGFPFPFDKDIYHELPSGAEVTGIEGLGDTGLMFTTKGAWAITNMSLDAVDAFGNIQQGVERINGDLILWGEHGLTPWSGGVIVPGLDDIHIMGPDGASQSITGTSENERVRRLYRSYTATPGYQPGPATVHRGHLFMPVVNGSTVVDTLVCRMDRDQAWTRWSGHASGAGYAVKPGSTSTAPKLLGLAGQRVTDLTGCFDPTGSNATDADGTAHVAEIITRDFPTGQQPGFVQRARLRYELEDGGTPDPAVAIAYSSDQDGGVFTDLTERGEQNGGAGWGVSDGSKYSWALVAKRRERIRFRVRVTGACSRFVLRSIELLTRPQGRQ